MQTFLPYPDFEQSAKSLDNKRLGKQRVECLQILQTLQKGPYFCPSCKEHKTRTNEYKTGYKCPDCECKMKLTPWYNHPAVKMWKGFEIALVRYGWYMCHEWIKRGFKDNLTHRILNFVPKDKNVDDAIYPAWIGKKEFTLSHKSNLIRKNPLYYIPIFGKDIPNNLPYLWPTKEFN